MKKGKKFGMILLAAAMLLSLATVALAAEGATTAKVTIGDGHTYTAYQIFTGDSQDVSADDGPIGGIKWGNGINEDQIGAFVDALKADETIKEYFDDGVTADAASVAEALSKIPEKNKSALRAFARVAKEYFTQNGTELKNGSAELPLGYYLIVDTTNVEGSEDVKNDLILQLTRDITVEKKYDVPSSEKKVKDDEEGSDYGTAAAYAIGDEIPFQITAVIQDKNYDAYETYVLKFVDTMSKGLTLNKESVSIYWMEGGTKHELKDEFNLTQGNYTDTNPFYTSGKVYTWTCDDIKDMTDAAGTPVSIPQGATVYLEYTAKLNENAAAGWDGNWNMGHIEFSNDPESNTTGVTGDDHVEVYTFQLDVHKKDGENKGLTGAGFTIYKLIPDDGASFGDDTPQKAGVPVSMSGYHWDLEKGKTLEVETDGYTFHAKGLDEGWYKLVESTVPAGYNKAEDIVFEVSADLDNGKLNETGAGGVTPEKIANSHVAPIIQEEEPTTTAGSEETGILSTDVVNQQGLTLPETGGIGTTIFYVLGAALVIGAAVLLVVRKRMSKYDG